MPQPYMRLSLTSIGSDAFLVFPHRMPTAPPWSWHPVGPEAASPDANPAITIHLPMCYVHYSACPPDTPAQNATTECQLRPQALALCAAASSAALRFPLSAAYCPLPTVYCPLPGEAPLPEQGSLVKTENPLDFPLRKGYLAGYGGTAPWDAPL